MGSLAYLAKIGTLHHDQLPQRDNGLDKNNKIVASDPASTLRGVLKEKGDVMTDPIHISLPGFFALSIKFTFTEWKEEHFKHSCSSTGPFVA